MDNYTKLFSSIITSTIWQEDNPTRILWITMLALSDADGMVEGSIPGLARMAGITIEDCEKAMAKLQSPDPYSRSKEHKGRRVGDVDGGWIILNRSKYRDKKVKRTDYHREYMRRYRTKNDVNNNVNNCKQKLTQKEKEKEKEVKDKNNKAKSNDFAIAFERARKNYPGVKRGFDTEFRDFKRKHVDWKLVVPLLHDAIHKEAQHKQQMKEKNEFCPQWAHFKTWLSQRRWEQELPDPMDGITHEADEDEIDRLLGGTQ